MKLTIGQYQQLYAIAKSKDDDIDKAIQSVSVLTGKTEREIDDMPYVEFNQLAQTVNTSFEKAKLNNEPKEYLIANGKKYRVNYDVPSFTQGQYTDIQAWLNGDFIENMDKILASISVEVKRRFFKDRVVLSSHAEKSENIKDVDFNDAYGCIVFFCVIFKSLTRVIVNSSESLKNMNPMQKKKLEQTMEDFNSIMDGFSIANV